MGMGDAIVIYIFLLVVASLIFGVPILVIIRIIYKLLKKKSIQCGVIDYLGLVFIFLILAAITIPYLLKFDAKRSKNTEGKMYLSEIYRAQVSYKRHRGVYAEGRDAFSLMRWQPWGMTMYAYYCGDDYLPNTKGDPVADDVPQMFGVRAAASAYGFTCLAIGNYDQDPDLDVWSINDAKVLQLIHDDTK